MTTQLRSFGKEIFTIAGAVLGLAACSSPDGGDTPATGGAAATGGAIATGGTLATTGGLAGQGGTATGGSAATGGTTSSGGIASTGGTTGGTAMSGGSTSTGGSSGGTSASGGTATTGGQAGNTGGSGGITAGTGGTAQGGSSGGSASKGGSSSSGGSGKGGGSTGGSSTGGSSTGGSSTGGSSTGGAAGNSCPLDLVGFATREGGTTGGGNAAPTTVTTQAELRACATASEPRVCRVQGTLTFSPFEEIKVASDKTIIGAGASANIVMGGFFVGTGVHNVIIRNLTIRDSFIEGQYDEGGDDGGDRDGVQLDTANHIWIDHMHFHHLGDGMIDSRKDTTLLTASWNVLEDHNKAFGIGWTENVTAELTIHHNWIHDTVQRNPSTDNVLRAHLFNNLLENVSSYGNYARGGTNMVLQNSVFVNVKDPHYYDTGTLVAIGNIYRSTTGQRTQTGTSFSFFDPGALYTYKLDPADQVEALIKRCAGPRAELGN
jgi:pectate lyase